MRKGITDNPAAVIEILENADVLWLALHDREGSYSVPVNFAHKDGILYVHSGCKGRKFEALCNGAPLSFSCASSMEPKDGGDSACNYGYRFKTVIGFGSPKRLKEDEAIKGLDTLTVKFAGKLLPYKEKALAATAVFAIDIASATARIKD